MTDQIPARHKSTPELVRQLSEDASRLVRDELKLAQAELKRKGADAAKGASLLGGGGVVAVYGVGCLIAAAVIGLAHVLAAWLAALVIGAVLLGVAGIAALAGRKELGKAAPPLPEETVRNVRADIEVVRGSSHGQ